MTLRALIFASLFAASLQAATPSLSVNTNSGTVTVQIPARVKSVRLESAGKSTGWTLYKKLSPAVSPSTVTVVLPKGYSSQKWRVSAAVPAPSNSPTKYPKKFFSGRKQFAASKAVAYTALSSSGGPTLSSGVATSVSGTVSGLSAKDPVASTNDVSQSDIWKLDGNTAYFFNQLRGLQVIDLSDPSNPSLIASYRLPAKGQNLYILPGAGSVHYAVLLTDESNATNYAPATGVKLIKVEGSSATLVDSTTVDGWLADSRLSGSLLYLATQQWAWNSGSTDSTTLQEVSVNTGSDSLALGAAHAIPGNWPVIAAGTGWLAVLESQYSDWQTSYLSLFTLTDTGAVPLTTSPIALYGRTYDKNSIRFDGAVLTAVSQRWEAPAGGNNWWQGTNVTKLENFDSTGSNLASLEIVRGETLNAVTYDGPRAYVVTSARIDPLFVLDLSTATNPVLAGQVEVPGWSTKIRPVGNGKLFTIGYDANWKLAASLFDVSDPSAPAQLTNLPLSANENWGYSAATYNDQALNVLPDAGLALIPYTGYDTNGVRQDYVQLLKLDTKAGTLALGGQVNHTFDPLRAALVGTSTLASISQRDLVTADISDLDQPALLADIQLAWPVNRVVPSGDYLIQISDGTGWWEKSSPSAVISPANDPESVLAQIPLGTGVIKDVALRGSTLHVLRQDPADAPLFWWGWSRSSSTNPATLYLDLYSISSLPALPQSGSASFPLPGSQRSWNIGQMLFPSDGLVALVAQPQGCFFRRWWGGPGPVVYAMQAKTAVAAKPKSVTISNTLIAVDPIPFDPWWGQPIARDPAIAVLFSTTNPALPAALPSVTLTTNTAAPVHFSTAGAGFLVFGYADHEGNFDDAKGISQANHKLAVLDLADPTAPALGAPLDLPGRLQAVSDLSRDGFLAWTTTCSGGTPQLQVSAYSASTLSQVTSQALSSSLITASGKSLFTTSTNGVTGYTLSEQGVLNSSGTLSLGWSPNYLKVVSEGAPLSLIAVSGQQLSLSTWGSSNPVFSNWQAGAWFEPSAVAPLSSGGVVVPEGEYGAELLPPQK